MSVAMQRSENAYVLQLTILVHPNDVLAGFCLVVEPHWRVCTCTARAIRRCQYAQGRPLAVMCNWRIGTQREGRLLCEEEVVVVVRVRVWCGGMSNSRASIRSTWHDLDHRLSRLDTRPGTREKAEQPDKSVMHVCSQNRSTVFTLY